MIPKLKAGILIKIPHLKGAPQEKADIYFQSFQKPSNCSIRKMDNDWYIDYQKNVDLEPKDTDNTIISGYDLHRLLDFSQEVASVIEGTNPDFYEKLKNWCNPQAYFFVGYWKDVENCYKRFPSMMR